MKLPSENIVEIVTFDVVEQLRLTVNQNLKLLENYQRQARDRTTEDPSDIVQGDVYQSLLKKHSDFFVSLMIHSDGVPLYKSKNSNAWPMLGALLELPPYARTRHDNVFLLCVWIGRRKPEFSQLFRRLIQKINFAKNLGIEINDGRKIHVLFPMLMGDMPALSAMVNFVEPNSFFACMFCNSKGVYNHDGRCVTYPDDHTASLRTSEEFRRCGDLAVTMNKRLIRNETRGRKGVSSFENILDVPLPHSVVIDSMHTVFLCHSKKLLIYLSKFISKPDIMKISSKLRSIKFIHDILRRPRSLVNLHKWKASEIRLFILYIGLPILIEYLPVNECGHLAMYVSILRLMHDHWEDDRKLYDAVCKLINLYQQDLETKIDEENYPPNLLTITTHTHLHLPLQCKKFGRLDWLTNFVFESFLGFLKAFVKGSSGAGEQIAFAFESNFVLAKIRNESKHRFGHFLIDNDTHGGNIIKSSYCQNLFDFLTTKDYLTNKTIVFSRLHYRLTTYHAFIYPRKGSTCSYLISYENDDAIEYGFILCFMTSENKCEAIVQKIQKVDRSITSYFETYKNLAAIKGFVDELFIVVKSTEPSLFDLNNTCKIAIDQIRSRCFYVPFETDFMIVTDYACAFEHN